MKGESWSEWQDLNLQTPRPERGAISDDARQCESAKDSAGAFAAPALGLHSLGTGRGVGRGLSLGLVVICLQLRPWFLCSVVAARACEHLAILLTGSLFQHDDIITSRRLLLTNVEAPCICLLDVYLFARCASSRC